MKKVNSPQQIEKVGSEKKIGKWETIWTWYQPEIPCNPNGCNRHYACHLWETGWRVGLRKFLWFKWLEFKRLYEN
jgi:hypothetical protein